MTIKEQSNNTDNLTPPTERHRMHMKGTHHRMATRHGTCIRPSRSTSRRGRNRPWRGGRATANDEIDLPTILMLADYMIDAYGNHGQQQRVKSEEEASGAFSLAHKHGLAQKNGQTAKMVINNHEMARFLLCQVPASAHRYPTTPYANEQKGSHANQSLYNVRCYYHYLLMHEQA